MSLYDVRVPNITYEDGDFIVKWESLVIRNQAKALEFAKQYLGADDEGKIPVIFEINLEDCVYEEDGGKD